MRGKKLDGLAHICDWYATVSYLAGVEPTDPSPPAVSPIDSINLWPWISGDVAASPRTVLVHDHSLMDCDTKNCSATKSCKGCYHYWGALRMGKWKMIVGHEGFEKQASWFGNFTPNASDPTPDFNVQMECWWHTPCLFNLDVDSTEHHNVAAANPAVVKQMNALFMSFNSSYI